jgi:hypothetical protein
VSRMWGSVSGCEGRLVLKYFLVERSAFKDASQQCRQIDTSA